MLNEQDEDEDDLSFYVKKSESNVLKPVSGLKSYGNYGDERLKINRDISTGMYNC